MAPSMQPETEPAFYESGTWVGYGEDVAGKKTETERHEASEAFEVLLAWIGWRLWMICSTESPRYAMQQLQLAKLTGISKSSISNAMNRTRVGSRTLAGDWTKVIDYFGVAPAQAFAFADRWKDTEAGRRWIGGRPPIAEDEYVPDPSPNLTAAIDALARRGRKVSERVYGRLRASQADKDRGIDEWIAQADLLQTIDDDGDLAAAEGRDRFIRAALRPPTPHRRRAKTVTSATPKKKSE